MSEPPVVDPRTYARWRATTLGRITEHVETELVFDLAGPLRGRRVLDVGTGDGSYALAAASRGGLVTAIDREPAMLAAARARANGLGLAIALQQGRAEALPFADASFDVVFAVTVLCFVTDASTALHEMTRVLVPGGRVVLGELARTSTWAVARRVRGWLGAEPWRRARFWSRAELSALARQAGLRTVEVRQAVWFPPNETLARMIAPWEPRLSRLRVPGGAFLALVADKP
jgi:ubiquinone/menaquinone biosynthesis C-methylase UbiE